MTENLNFNTNLLTTKNCDYKGSVFEIKRIIEKLKRSFGTLQEKNLLLTVFYHQGRVYLSRYVIIYICHLCQCQKKFKSTLTFTYVKVVSISTNDGIFVNMTYINVSFTFVKVGFNIC